MLDQRRRRCADVVQMLYKCFVFGRLVLLAAYCWPRLQADTDPMLVKCWAIVLASIHSVLVSTSFRRTCMLAV